VRHGENVEQARGAGHSPRRRGSGEAAVAVRHDDVSSMVRSYGGRRR
jgi:hypothetical protein